VPCRLSSEKGRMEVIPIALDSIHRISSIKIHLPNDLTRSKSKDVVLETLRAIAEKFDDSPPLLHPVKDMKIDNK
jgi:ATP-dependent RNA helicase DOB1